MLVLIVEDDRLVARSFLRLLDGHDTDAAYSVREALEHIESGKAYDLMILDLNLPDGPGEEVAEVARQQSKAPFIAAVTGERNNSERAVALHGLVDLFVPKPFSHEAVLAILTRAHAHRYDPIAEFAAHYGLSNREQIVLSAAVSGSTETEITDLLETTPGTVKSYWKRIFDKTEIRSQRDVVKAAKAFVAGDS